MNGTTNQLKGWKDGTQMTKKINLMNTLPWLKFWTGNFKSKTDHLSNAEVGAYVRLLASYWDNNGLPFNDRALTRIAKIEDEENVDLGAILGEFFFVKDGSLRHEELDAQRIEAIGEEDANRRRTLPARFALAKQRNSVTVPVAETEVEVEGEGEEDPEPESESESERDSHPNGRPRNQTYTQNEDPDSQSEVRPVASESGYQVPVQTTLTRAHQSVSLKPDGGAQGAAVPAVSPVHFGISFRLKDGSSIPLPASVDGSRPSVERFATLKQLAERFESIPETRVIAEELPNVMKQWLQPSREAAA